MLNRLRPWVVGLRTSNPRLYSFILGVARRFMRKRLGVYPRPLAAEERAVREVLRSAQWNMVYRGGNLAHERLEADFAQFTGTREAIAVASGGVALQMSMRALGLKPGDEAIHQIDTCSATAMATMNAAITPIFADVSSETFMLDLEQTRSLIGPNTRAIIGTHMWGNPENLEALRALADSANLRLIEDSCLALGATAQGRPAGSRGDVGVFSFGCIKPIQTGEGGMIVTDDEALARELRAMRHWGDRTIDFGVRDAVQLSWNGRMSEILAALAREQLRGYPAHLATLRENVAEFERFLRDMDGLELVLGAGGTLSTAVFTQVVLRIDESRLPCAKAELMRYLAEQGVPAWHANFELINSLTFFREGRWREWILRGDLDRIAANYSAPYPSARRLFNTGGVGLSKMNFLSSGNLGHLKRVLSKVMSRDWTAS